MMKMLFYMIFMIPGAYFYNWYVMVILLLIMMLYIMTFFSFSIAFSCFSYFLGVDFISLIFVYLSLWVIILIFLSSKNMNNMGEFSFVVLCLLIFLFVSFSVSNLFLFYFFFECTLIPTVFLIFGWGYQPERLMAGYYMLFYTLFFSLPMLLGIFYIYSMSNTLFYFILMVDMNMYLYLSMFMAFLVKFPLVFLHFWLPKAHVEAPISGSMILAGVLLKLGGYGIIRIYNFNTYLNLNCFFICLSLYGMFVVGFLCIFQIDMKTLIAYSSVSHMAIVLGGLMSLNYVGSIGSVVLMVGHGLCSSGMFCLANFYYERSGSRVIFLNKGMLMLMPSMSMFWFLFMINNMSSPFSLNFLGEVLLINSLMSWDYFSMIFLIFSCFLSCLYSIYLYSYINHGNSYGGMNFIFNGYYIEYMLIFMHFFPLNLLFLSVDVFSLFI